MVQCTGIHHDEFLWTRFGCSRTLLPFGAPPATVGAASTHMIGIAVHVMVLKLWTLYWTQNTVDTLLEAVVAGTVTEYVVDSRGSTYCSRIHCAIGCLLCFYWSLHDLFLHYCCSSSLLLLCSMICTGSYGVLLGHGAFSYADRYQQACQSQILYCTQYDLYRLLLSPTCVWCLLQSHRRDNRLLCCCWYCTQYRGMSFMMLTGLLQTYVWWLLLLV